MDVSPLTYAVFFLAWLGAAALFAHIYYAFIESRRYAALVVGAAATFVLGAVGVVIAGHWSDATTASSLLHQRLFLIGLACAGVAVSGLIGLKAYRSRWLRPAWHVSLGLMLFVAGIAVGTTELADASFGEVVARFAGAYFLLSMLVICRPKAVTPATTAPATTAPEAAAPRRVSGQPLSDASR